MHGEAAQGEESVLHEPDVRDVFATVKPHLEGKSKAIVDMIAVPTADVTQAGGKFRRALHASVFGPTDCLLKRTRKDANSAAFLVTFGL